MQGKVITVLVTCWWAVKNRVWEEVDTFEEPRCERRRTFLCW